jgi:hypothetical protein
VEAVVQNAIIALVVIYFVGFLVAMVVTRHRAGVGQGRITIFGREGFGLEWFLRHVVTVAFWPVSLGLWLAGGRPEPRVVFNERAAERVRATQGNRH